MIEFRLSTFRDCEELAPIMRQADVKEAKASHGLDPLGALVTCLQNSKQPETILVDGQIVAMCGVGHSGLVGYPWLLGSRGLVSNAKKLHSLVVPWLENYQEQYKLLYNYVAVENQTSVRWLRQLGFVMIRLIPDHGVLRQPFYEFVRIQKCV